ncbi:MAG: hypothetical protein HYY84_17090 [Deltaproteobacteria bacterium]|nr:hypothetical protein [Deltaproteobacteria bacterium]
MSTQTPKEFQLTDADAKKLSELLEPEYSRKRTVHFIVANLLAIGVCAGLFLLFFYGDFLTSATDAIMAAFSKSELAIVLVASMPLIIGVWMGAFYSRRRAQRRKAEKLRAELDGKARSAA